ncbi:MAG: ABC transporter ATP-binding protein [Kiritimatiellae bacterium]|jgi:ABC-type lipoprotein export system ATPase subunit|nr:ABC transporter ATP-binding protein [Kiritimatiellia bacterium]
MLKANNLFKSYTLPHKQVDVLKGAQISVGENERVAIVGRSGAGKSTLLHVLGGLDRPESGDVIVDDQSLYSISRRKRTAIRAARIGFVFQSYHLLPEMDVAENVMLPALTGVLKLSRAEMKARALDLLERVGLSDRASHMPMELSGGEQQRVALARALMNTPALILADEPTGNLDSKTGSAVMKQLFELASLNKAALVMVTHSMQSAALCDRVLEIKEGLLVEA